MIRAEIENAAKDLAMASGRDVVLLSKEGAYLIIFSDDPRPDGCEEISRFCSSIDLRPNAIQMLGRRR